MEIHRLARFKTIYSNNNNNNNVSPVLISGHVMKSQQPCVAGMRNALKFHQLKPLTGESLNDCGRSTAWTKPQGRSAIEEIGLTPPFALHPTVLEYFAGEKQPAHTQTVP